MVEEGYESSDECLVCERKLEEAPILEGVNHQTNVCDECSAKGEVSLVTLPNGKRVYAPGGLVDAETQRMIAEVLE